MSDFPVTSEKTKDLLEFFTPGLAAKRSEAELAKSRRFQGPSISSSVPEFLIAKRVSLCERVEYLNDLQLALDGLGKDGMIPISESREKCVEIESVKLALRWETLATKLFENRLTEDITDDLENSPPFVDLDDSYSAVISPIVNGTSAEQGKKGFTRFRFKREVLEFYGASRKTKHGQKQAFCHLLGWEHPALVRATQLVPRTVNGDAFISLFGRGLKPATDPGNAPSMYITLKSALDSGKIVIVPVVGEKDAWKCVVTIADGLDGPATHGFTFNDINGKHLQFNNARRPRKQYLFFRYLITYLYQKRNGNLRWAQKIENEFRERIIDDRYLQSPLRIFLQKVTDEDLPEMMFQMFGCTADTGLADLSDKEKRHRKDHISHLIDSAVLNTRTSDEDDDSESESDDEYKSKD